MGKIFNDKYYTDPIIAKKCIDKTFEMIGINNITEIIEPSAGDGSFSLQMDCIAYDIVPENSSVIEQDYLKLNINYKKGRLIIGNPPFGDRFSIGLNFFKKSIEISDYISFILPISQYNNIMALYEFDLIHSEDLGKLKFSDRNLHCCFNIYKRPENGLNKKNNNKLEDILIIRQDSKGYNLFEEDVVFCYWGSSAGKILRNGEKYAGTYKIKILNKELKIDIINLLETINWKQELKFIAMPRIKNYDIYNILKKYIPGIK